MDKLKMQTKAQAEKQPRKKFELVQEIRRLRKESNNKLGDL